MTWFEILSLPLGLALGWGYVLYARRFGARELQVLASGLIIAALIYVVTALWTGAGVQAVVIEVAGTAVFSVFAFRGLRRASAWLAFGWALHAGWDLAGQLASDPVMPLWYAIACLGFDVIVAGAILREPDLQKPE